MITFGEVIKYKETEYVYLAATEEIIYLAKILNHYDGKKVNELFLKRQSQGAMNTVKIADSPLYCFVILTTENFKNRMAHLAKPGYNFELDFNIDQLGRLNDDDLKQIKFEIINGSVPLELKSLVKDIEL